MDFPDISALAQHPLSVDKIDTLMRQHMEACLFKLRSLGIEALATGTGNPPAAALKLRTEIRPEFQKTLGDAARDAGVYAKWRNHLEIYDVHPALTDSLLRLGSKSKIPGSVFRRLRHPNPYFALASGVPLTHGDGQPGRIFGFYAVGALSPAYPMSTGVKAQMTHLENLNTSGKSRASALLDSCDPTANALHVLLTSDVLDQDKETVLDLDMCHLTIPMTADFTLDELVDEVAVSGFSWAPDMQGPRKESSERPYLKVMARTAISHLLYACSRTVEIADSPAVEAAGKRKKGAVKARKQTSKIHPVGHRVGAAIEDRAISQSSTEGAAPGTGVKGFKMPPHIRAPHPHLYWVGEGRREAEIKFLDPIPVNLKTADDGVVTRHPMK